MSNDDFYNQAARRQYQTLQAARARLVANLEEFKANGDDISAAEEIQTLATINDQMQSLERLHSRYQQSLNPPPPAPETENEWLSKSAERMTPDDAIRIHSKSKYFPKNPETDADFVNGFRKGVAEVARKRAEESGR
jgi:hypothetical protein